MNDISALISQMQQPSFYPHAVTEKIELMQTHASYVFLTGDYVYKLKKEVDFGFLDYSTLAKRKHFIEAELRLNQKIAPQLYLEVLSISKGGNKFILGDRGEIVKYALKMRAFSQSNLFTNLLEAGKLDRENFTNLGKIVAQFHLSAATSDYI
ncbi:MAG: adenylyl-sulfate kinase, partial [Cyanobacteria bacterium J06598_4]